MLRYFKKQYVISSWYQFLIICIAVLVVYYPSISAEICLLDDQEMISNLFNTYDVDIMNIFRPGSAGGGYYRPFIGLSYYFDRFVWFLSPEIMHFENIFFHLINSLLVFGICRQLSNHLSITSLIPLLTSLLFALHPVNSESVNWISGRTDLLAGSFVFASAFIIVKYHNNYFSIILSIILIVFGSLAKETALAFIPGFFFLFRGMQSGVSGVHVDAHSTGEIKSTVAGSIISVCSAMIFFNYVAVVVIAFATFLLIIQQREKLNLYNQGIKLLLVFASTLFFGYFVFWTFRRFAYTSDMPRIAVALKTLSADINATFHFFFGAIGYYVKKMIWPLPLNFTILEIDPLYSLLGVVLLMLSVFLLSHTSIVSGLLLAAFCLLMPALPLSIAKIAWTPYAERYVYLALPFVLIAIILVIAPLIKQQSLYYILMSILFVFTLATVQRNFVWQKNVSIFADVVEKNPDFKPGRGLYMVALYNQNKFELAAEQYYAAQLLPSVMYDEEFDLVMAGMLTEQKKYEEAEKIYLTAFNKTKAKNAKVVRAVVNFYLAKKSRSKTVREKELSTNEILRYLDVIQNIDKSSGGLYKTGQTYLAIGEKERARAVFEQAREDLQYSNPMKTNIDKLLLKLNK